MVTSTELYQGDSSDIVSVSVYSDGVLVEDLTGYVGKFSVVKNLGDEPLLEDDMVVVGTAFRYQIAPADSEDLAPGLYAGIVEISNSFLAFKKEYHLPVTINKQGYGA